jgi:hypothetical protein
MSTAPVRRSPPLISGLGNQRAARAPTSRSGATPVLPLTTSSGVIITSRSGATPVLPLTTSSGVIITCRGAVRRP